MADSGTKNRSTVTHSNGSGGFGGFGRAKPIGQAADKPTSRPRRRHGIPSYHKNFLDCRAVRGELAGAR